MAITLWTLLREPSSQKATQGALYMAGRWVAWTLEDVVRERAGVPVAAWKVAGRTAIPRGEYRFTAEHSPRFGRVLPSIPAVPGFEGIRVHGGNTEADTEGCPLVGLVRGVDRISTCPPAVDLILSRLATGEHRIRIMDVPATIDR